MAVILTVVLGWPSGLLAAPQERRIERVKGGEAAAGTGGRWAVVVGVDRYQAKAIEPLSGAVADARAIRDVLIKYAEFPENQVTLLVSDGQVKPSAGIIMDRLDEIRKASKSTDLLLFYFAGHGVQVDGQRYLLTYEADVGSTGRLKTTSLPASTLMQEIESVHVAHRVIMVDACRNDPTNPGQRNLSDEAFENAFTLQPTSETGVRATFLSSSKGQSAYEWTEKHRGFFSWFIEKGLSGEAAQFGKVTVTSLLTYLNEMVPQKVREQKNQVQVPYAKVDGSELVLVRSEKLPAQTATLDKQPPVAAARTIYGVVKDSSGMPLSGVTITVALASIASRGVGGKAAPSPELKVTTDEDGFFKADGVAPDTDVKVTAAKDSFLPKTLVSPPAEAGKKLVVFLPRAEASRPVAVADAGAGAAPAKKVAPGTKPPAAKPAAATPPPTMSAPPLTAEAQPAAAAAPPPTAVAQPAAPAAQPTTTAAKPATASAKRAAAGTKVATGKPAPATVATAAPAETLPPPAAVVPSPAETEARGNELAMIAYRTFLAEDFKEAENGARQALQVDPESALANAVLGNAMAAIGANSGDVQRTIAAKEFISKALGRDPAQPLAHNALALTLMVQGKNAEAVDELRKAIQGDPKLAVAPANLAYILRSQNKLPEAEREYREAIRLDPESAVPYNGLSAVLFSMGKYKDAVKACREAISRYQLRDRFLGLFYVQLAVAQYQQGHQGEALEAVGRAKALGVSEHDAYNTITKPKPGKKG